MRLPHRRVGSESGGALGLGSVRGTARFKEPTAKVRAPPLVARLSASGSANRSLRTVGRDSLQPGRAGNYPLTARGLDGTNRAPNSRPGAIMEKLIAYCGLDCAVCPAFTAARTNDQALRVKTASEWSQQFNAAIKPEDINCSGCTSTSGVVFQHCKVCEIRRCGQDRKIDNCALCADFGCDKLAGIHQAVPDARAALEAIRSQRRV